MRRRDFMKTVGFGAAALYALFFVMFVSMAEANAESERAPYPNGVLKAWETEYKELSKGIKARPSSINPSASALLNRHSRILPSDKSPAGVVIRRTEALLKHMKTLPGAAGIKNFQQKLNGIKKSSMS